MYEEFFGLKEKPFSIQPDPSFLYWGRSHRLAYAMLEYGVLNHAGISVISGEVGCGKTTLIHRLLDQLSDTHSVALLSNIQAGRGDLLSWVLMGFGQPFAGKTHVELFAQLQEFFISEYSQGRRVILIIDEAQNLSIDMLEELRMLSNINAGKDQLLQLILVGQPQLKDLLNRPEMLQLAQRIGSDFHLTPLSREEVEAYIETRLAIAGAERRMFAEGAIDLIADQSRGVPRVINIIADTALVYAFSAQQAIVDADTVRDVIRDKLEFGVFGIAAQRQEPGPSGEGPSAFVRKEPPPEPKADAGVDAETATVPKVAAPTPAAPRSRSKEKPRMPARGRPLAPPAAPHAPASSGALARKAEPIPITAQVKSEPQNIPPVEIHKPPAKRTLHAVPDEPAKPAERAPALSRVGVVVAGCGAVAQTVSSVNDVCRVVYVGQTEDEARAIDAEAAGAEALVIADRALSPGRARNAGYRELNKRESGIDYVQFVDAGFVLDPAWLEAAARFMDRRPEVAVVEGRITDLRGRPLHPIGEGAEEMQAAGSAALVRAEAFESAGGFRGDLVVNETADLCIRLRRRGAHVWRLEAMMGATPDFAASDWWKRAAQRGFEYAHGADLHGAPPDLLFRAELMRAIIWGAVMPLLIAVAAVAGAGLAALLLPTSNPLLVFAVVVGLGALVYLAKVMVTAFQYGPGRAGAWLFALGETMAHIPEAAGIMRFHFGGARMKAAARGVV